MPHIFTKKSMKRSFLLLIVYCFVFLQNGAALSDYARSKGFVYLHEIDPTIRTSLRYISSENFVGAPVDGYEKNVVVLTKQAAEGLKRVQQRVHRDGYCLVVYDAYRPQRAVQHFVRWAKNLDDQITKSRYYPRIEKGKCFTLGYIAERSGHSRGSTVDLTIIKATDTLHPVQISKCTLLDGFYGNFF